MTDLLCCPFCGEPAEGPKRANTRVVNWSVGCSMYCCLVQWYKTPAAAAQAWNRRTAATPAPTHGEGTVFCTCNQYPHALDCGQSPAPATAGDAEYKQCGWFLSGPHATNLVTSRDEIEEDIARMCKLTGDDPDDYTATPVYVKFVKWPDIKAALANPPTSAGAGDGVEGEGV